LPSIKIFYDVINIYYLDKRKAYTLIYKILFKFNNISNIKILLQFNGTKLGLLGKKNNRILCMVLESNERIEDYVEEIRDLTQLLSETNSVDDFVNALPEALSKTKDLST